MKTRYSKCEAKTGSAIRKHKVFLFLNNGYTIQAITTQFPITMMNAQIFFSRQMSKCASEGSELTRSSLPHSYLYHYNTQSLYN